MASNIKSDRADFRAFLREVGLTQAELNRAALRVDYVETLSAQVKVARSAIHGKGVLSTLPIPAGARIGPAMLGSRWTAIGRFANHSRRPTAAAEKTRSGMRFVALGPIQIGDEVTVDYRQVREVLASQRKAIK